MGDGPSPETPIHDNVGEELLNYLGILCLGAQEECEQFFVFFVARERWWCIGGGHAAVKDDVIYKDFLDLGFWWWVMVFV